MGRRESIKTLKKAYLLLALTGVFGGHRFYLNKPKSALIMLLTTCLSLGTLLIITIPWALIDILYIPKWLNDLSNNNLTSSTVPSKKRKSLSNPKVNNKLMNHLVLNKNSSTDSLFANIPTKILNTLWLKDGFYKNIPSDSDEPSAITISLPISKTKALALGYYPSYVDLTPEQRFAYLSWLSNMNNKVDIGFFFLQLYGCERHIYENNHVQDSIDIIIDLLNKANNKSFTYYSTNALLWASQKYKTTKFFDNLDLNKLEPNAKLFLMLSIDGKLDLDTIISISKYLGWDNLRYIKSEPKLFKEILGNELIKKYSMSAFPKPEYIEKVPKIKLILSNYSLPESERVLAYPDFSKAKEVGGALTEILKDSHNHVKLLLAEKRKNNS